MNGVCIGQLLIVGLEASAHPDFTTIEIFAQFLVVGLDKMVLFRRFSE